MADAPVQSGPWPPAGHINLAGKAPQNGEKTMQRTRTPRHRPSPAMLVALTALVVAMSGTAVAATGGDFILGKANKAASVTALSNTKGTALALSSAEGKPPLTVSSSSRILKLNASLLDGHRAAAFLPVNGTAANANELGGKSALDYMTGGGQISHLAGTAIFNNTVTLNLPTTPDLYSLQIACTSGGQAQLTLTASTSINVWYSNPNDSVQGFAGLSDGQAQSFGLTPGPQMITLQAADHDQPAPVRRWVQRC